MWDRMRKLRHLVIATQLRLKNYFPWTNEMCVYCCCCCCCRGEVDGIFKVELSSLHAFKTYN
jgi:hypothetical protein